MKTSEALAAIQYWLAIANPHQLYQIVLAIADVMVNGEVEGA